MSGLAIREVAERTGLAAGTIRMWEQRYGFPEPQRTPSGYRQYSPQDVDTLKRVIALRASGLSVAAALERARAATVATDRPSLFGAVPSAGRVRLLRKRTLIAMSHAIEDETLAQAAAPVILAAFQRERHFRAVEQRYRRLTAAADAAVVFADFARARTDGDGPDEVPIDPASTVGHEWAVVVDAPGFSACLVAWEPPVEHQPADDLDRRFETFWTLDAHVVRQAAHAGAAVARGVMPDVAARVDAILSRRPLGADRDVAAVEALASRMIAYVGG